MIIVPAAGFAQFGTSAFTNALAQAGNSNSDSTRTGSTPLVNSLNSDLSTPTAALTNNPTTAANTTSLAHSNPNQALNSTSSSPSSSCGGATGGLNSQAHSGTQWLGASLRAPMGSGGDPNKQISQNIYFKFRGDANKDVPAIWMWINPNQLVINHSKKIQEQVTRGGFVLFHWGDNLDEISASAVSGSFARLDRPQSNNKMGYTAAQPDVGLDRRDTWPYLRFMQVLALYRNNGISISSTGMSPNAGGFAPTSQVIASATATQSVGPSTNLTGVSNSTSRAIDNGSIAAGKNQSPIFSGIEMHYDDHIFTGYFTTFTWTERAEDPYKFSFDFKFTVLNTQYNKVFQTVCLPIKPNDLKAGLLGNFQIPRFNSL